MLSCNTKNEIINGELYFKLVNFLPNEGLNKEQFSKMKSDIGKLSESKNHDELRLYVYLEKLEKNNLLASPNITIKMKNNELRVIFLNQKEYQKLKTYTLNDLNSRGKKIVIKLKVKEIDTAIFYSDKIISIKEINGKTSWSK